MTRIPPVVLAVTLLSLLLFSHAARAGGLVIGVTPVFLDDQLSLLRAWGEYLSTRLGQPVSFVQRGSYREIVNLTLDGKLQFAWICGYPYVTARERLQLAAVPLYKGEPLYQAYFIVPAEDQKTRTLTDLAGQVFAYSDPDSNSGYIVPRVQLARLGRDPEHFFRKAFFTGAHRKVVEAVAAGLADGGAVDGYVWDTLARSEPGLTARTRVVERSQPFGFPPLVAGPEVDGATVRQFRDVLAKMKEEPDGRALLDRMNLDGFAAGEPTLYNEIRAMEAALGSGGR